MCVHRQWTDLQPFAKTLTVASHDIDQLGNKNCTTLSQILTNFFTVIMYRKISCDVKIAAMNLYEWNLLSLEQILDCVGFLESTFWHTLQLWRETGDVVNHPKGSPGCPRTLHFDDVNYLIQLINHRPTWFLNKLLSLLKSNHFIATHFTTIHRELVCAGISLKKLRKIAKEQDKDKRAEFVRWMSQYSPEEIRFIDETSKDERTAFRRNGRARKGMHAQKRGVFVQGHRLSAVGLLTLDGMAASNVIKGSFTTEKFVHFLEHDVVSPLLFSQFC